MFALPTDQPTNPTTGTASCRGALAHLKIMFSYACCGRAGRGIQPSSKPSPTPCSLTHTDNHNYSIINARFHTIISRTDGPTDKASYKTFDSTSLVFEESYRRDRSTDWPIETRPVCNLAPPPPPMEGGNQRVWRWGRKSKGEKREEKKILGKYNFWKYQIIKTG